MLSIETPRLILREFREDDWRYTNEYESDPEVLRFQSFDQPFFSPQDSRDYLARSMASAQENPRTTYDLAITPKDDEARVIGRCGLAIRNQKFREGEVWFVLHRAHWGSGLMVEAARALMTYGFRELHLHRIFGDCDPRNARSAKLLERLGMRREAHHIKNYLHRGEWTDTWIYAVLDEEWK